MVYEIFYIYMEHFILFCQVLRSSYQEGRLGRRLTGLSKAQFCAYPKPGPGLPTSYVVAFFVSSEFR